ncbi:hypothetical protein U0070_017688 [Myodes glareolus]|uniref:Uncharacterized protein n=1 Tax=Myodes glareolus TaxID=447135 RepID=A0AAW0K676_MYOGA
MQGPKRTEPCHPEPRHPWQEEGKCGKHGRHPDLPCVSPTLLPLASKMHGESAGGRCDIKLLSTPADFQLALRQETSPLRTAKTCVSGYPERPGSQTPPKHSSGR